MPSDDAPRDDTWTEPVATDERREVERLTEELAESEARRRRTLTGLAASEARFRALAERVPVGVFSADLSGAITYANSLWARLAPGVTDLGDLEPRPGSLTEQLHAVAQGEATELNADIHRADRSAVRLSAAVVADATTSLVGTLVDISNEAELRGPAEIDELTQLANRETFDRELDLAMRTERDEIAVLLLDLDGMTSVNEEHGREAGDQILKAIAQRLTHTLRPGDVVARYHGDQFAMMCRGVQVGNENIITARIDNALVDPISWPGGWWQPSVSVGVVRGTEGHDREELMMTVQASMRRAKRGRVMAPTLDSLRDLSSLRARDTD